MSVQIANAEHRRSTAPVCLLALIASVAGCGRTAGEPATPGFMPSWPEARQALEASLSAWRDAPPAGSPPIDVKGAKFVDKQSESHRRLLSFQILAQTDIDNARQFTVRLNLEGEDSPLLAKYNVVGREPVWVFRLDDYETFAHWEHDMTAPVSGSVATPKSVQNPAGAK